MFILTIIRFTTFNVRTNVWSEGPPMLDARKCHGAAVMETGDHNLDVKTKRRRNRETVGKTDGRTNGQTGERTDRRINISSRATDATGVHEGRRVKTL